MATIILTASCVAGGAWMVVGEVLSVTDEGILVYCNSGGRFGQAKPKDGTVAFIIGKFSYVDGDKVNLMSLEEAGIYKYGSAGGAAKTVKAFKQ